MYCTASVHRNFALYKCTRPGQPVHMNVCLLYTVHVFCVQYTLFVYSTQKTCTVHRSVYCTQFLCTVQKTCVQHRKSCILYTFFLYCTQKMCIVHIFAVLYTFLHILVYSTAKTCAVHIHLVLYMIIVYRTFFKLCCTCFCLYCAHTPYTHCAVLHCCCTVHNICRLYMFIALVPTVTHHCSIPHSLGVSSMQL